MAETVKGYCGFECASVGSGTDRSAWGWSGSDSAANPPDGRSTNTAKLLPKGTIISPLMTADTSNWWTFFMLRKWTDLDVSLNQTLLKVMDSSNNRQMELRWKAAGNGTVEVLDSNGVVQGSFVPPFTPMPSTINDYWHWIYIKWEHKTSGDIHVWWRNSPFPPDKSSPDFSLTAEDFQSSTGNIYLRIDGHGTVGNAERVYVDQIHALTDDGANYDTNNSFHPHWIELGPYIDDSKTGASPYFGDNLLSGDFENTQKVPATDGDVAVYRGDQNIGRDGGIFTESATTPSGKHVGDGPEGDGYITGGEGVILGCNWMWKTKLSSLGSPLSRPGDSFHKYGAGDRAQAEGNDNTLSYTRTWSQMSTSYVGRGKFLEPDVANDGGTPTDWDIVALPDREVFQIGFGIDVNGGMFGFGVFDITCSTMQCSILWDAPYQDVVAGGHRYRLFNGS